MFIELLKKILKEIADRARLADLCGAELPIIYAALPPCLLLNHCLLLIKSKLTSLSPKRGILINLQFTAMSYTAD